jgi:acetyl-CoA carboxylase beta subunit
VLIPLSCPYQTVINLFDEKSFGSKSIMGVTLIVKCTKCGGLMLVALGQKTKICPYCGTTVTLQKVQRLAAANNAFEASEMLRKIKSSQKTNR